MPTIEERLAALEAKLAALTDTTPTTYYEHQYSGEEIDNAVSRALPNGAIDQSVGTFVRPNLLDNWYFGRPVNQSGQTEYMVGGTYTLDRWMSSTTDKTVKILDDHIVIVDTADNGAFLQRFDYKGLLGKTVTFSVLARRTAQGAKMPYIAVMVGNNKFEGYSEIVQSDDYQLASCTVTLSAVAPSEGYFFVVISGMAGASIEIKAAKLELGPAQTLAHREGDKWVINEVPEYGEQLRRCLRHDYILGNSSQNCPIGVGTAYSNDGVVCVIQLPEYMRTNPAVVLSGEVQIRFSATKILTATSVINYGFSGDKVQLYFPGLSGLTPGQSCDLFTQTNSRLEFNSNL